MSSESNAKETKPVIEPVDVGEICAVCRVPIADNNNERSLVTLRYCVGSAFNAKNRMECPLCRQTEKGDWLFAKPTEPDTVDEPTMMWIDNVLSSAEGYIEGLFDNTVSPIHLPYALNPTHSSYALNQIRDNDNTRRNDLSLEARRQRQLEEHLALIVESERRLQEMMYEYHGITGGNAIGDESSIWGGSESSGGGDSESSGGGDGESSGGDAVAEEEVEMMEE
ncbi:uncharacterized protein LOC17879298 [Capsella rubella]|uniref:uncharacterized protein LOC17879298 n=1 Tax=Capsella rubella TaxID=81985 RepID=UPI000CD54905|nr:uncharacterized protein LOC17879298 [Capsella rubella]